MNILNSTDLHGVFSDNLPPLWKLTIYSYTLLSAVYQLFIDVRILLFVLAHFVFLKVLGMDFVKYLLNTQAGDISCVSCVLRLVDSFGEFQYVFKPGLLF